MIPRIIHRIWLGGDLPPDARRYGDSWAQHCPGWEIRTWRDWDLPPLVNQRAFDAATSPAQRADIARLEILLRFGGVYVDTDFEALQPLEPVLDGVGCFAATEDGRFVSSGIMGSVPQHPFIAQLVASVSSSIAANPGLPPNKQSGPWFITAKLHRFRRRDRGEHPVVVFPPELFYPYHFSEPERRGELFPDAIAVHHWSASWTSL